MTEDDWKSKWKALVDRVQKIEYEKNKPWSMKATGASASCSVGSFGLTGFTFSLTGASVSITGLALSFTGVWGQTYGTELKSHNGLSRVFASRQRVRANNTDIVIGNAAIHLIDKDMGTTANNLIACHLA